VKKVTVNKEQRLYVIPEECGFTCLGFDVCEKRTVALAAELAARGHGIGKRRRVGTLAHYHRWSDLCQLALDDHRRTGWRSSAELTPELVGYEGKRVEVRHRWESTGREETVRFNVGKSTGHIPCHLMLHNRRSIGGAAVCLGKILSVREV